jgi:hypothetical protein
MNLNIINIVALVGKANKGQNQQRAKLQSALRIGDDALVLYPT